MRKTKIHLEVVSVEEAKKAREREKLLAKRNGNRKLAVKKLRASPRRHQTKSTAPEVQGT